jgi:hypothetical protein
MDTFVMVKIECNQNELNTMEPFFRAAEFTRFDSKVEIHCMETGQRISVECKKEDANCYGWRHFANVWQRRFGRIHK